MKPVKSSMSTLWTPLPLLEIYLLKSQVSLASQPSWTGSPVLAASSNCTECPKASVCFLASLTNSHTIVELLCALLQGSTIRDFLHNHQWECISNSCQPALTSSNFLYISNPEISWIDFSPIPPNATLLREWRLLIFISPSSFIQLKISVSFPLLH